jgi:hypothetical protein
MRREEPTRLVGELPDEELAAVRAGKSGPPAVLWRPGQAVMAAAHDSNIRAVARQIGTGRVAGRVGRVE